MINAMNQGTHGSIFAIACWHCRQPKDLGVHRKRIPTWVLPNSMIAIYHKDPQAAREKVRPDEMVAELTKSEQQRYENGANMALWIWCQHDLPPSIINQCRQQSKEVCLLGGLLLKYQRYVQIGKKEQQHQNLVSMLTQYTQRGYDGQFRHLPLGCAASIYKTHIEAFFGT